MVTAAMEGFLLSLSLARLIQSESVKPTDYRIAFLKLTCMKGILQEKKKNQQVMAVEYYTLFSEANNALWLIMWMWDSLLTDWPRLRSWKQQLAWNCSSSFPFPDFSSKREIPRQKWWLSPSLFPNANLRQVLVKEHSFLLSIFC